MQEEAAARWTQAQVRPHARQALDLASGKLQAGLWADWIAVEAADVPDDALEDFLVDDEPDVRVVCVEGEILLDGRW